MPQGAKFQTYADYSTGKYIHTIFQYLHYLPRRRF